MPPQSRQDEVVHLLDIHYEAYCNVKPFADRYGHPHPTDTRGWSQILVSSLTDISGIERKKGPDLEDGSDVKAANCWDAIDTPRFNGCVKAGTKAVASGSLDSLDSMPFLFLVLWDTTETTHQKRFRIWVVRPQADTEFRRIAADWYDLRRRGEIKSDNFQLHPPRNLDSNVIRNSCGNLEYPLLFSAHLSADQFTVVHYDEGALVSGACVIVND